MLCSGLSFIRADNPCTWDLTGGGGDADSDLQALNQSDEEEEDEEDYEEGGYRAVITYRDQWTQTDFPFDDDDPLDVSVLSEAWPVSSLKV